MASLRPDSELVNDAGVLNDLKKEWNKAEQAKKDSGLVEQERTLLLERSRLARRGSHMVNGNFTDAFKRIQRDLEDVERRILVFNVKIADAMKAFYKAKGFLPGNSEAPEPGPSSVPVPDIVEEQPPSRASMYAHHTAQSRNPTSDDPAGHPVPIGGSPPGRRSTTLRGPPPVSRGGGEELNNSTLKF